MKKILTILLIAFAVVFADENDKKNENNEKISGVFVEFKGSFNGPAPGVGYAVWYSQKPFEYAVCVSWTKLLDPKEREKVKFIGGKLRINFFDSLRESNVTLYPVDFSFRYKVFNRNGFFVGGGASVVFATIKTFSWTKKEKSGSYVYPSIFPEIGFTKKDVKNKDGMAIFYRPAFIHFFPHYLNIKTGAPIIKYDIIQYFGLIIFF